MSIKTMPKPVAANIENFAGRTWVLPRVLDWIEHGIERTLLVTGEPGTGKSSLAAWLAGAGRTPAAADARHQLERIRSHVKAVH
jgi:energy-coupling factor transporter ATP-binding protein EcfA2